MKPAYKVVVVDGLGTPFMTPWILKVDVSDVNGRSWKDAKKQLRKYHIDHAANVRQLREKDTK